MTITEKLNKLRQQMALYNIDAYIIPSSDPHQSEYLSAHWKIREWMSGFSGSAGTLITTATTADLWTDSRYFIQAEQELTDSVVQLQRQLIPHAPEHIAWLCENLPEGATVGLDGRLFSISQTRYIEKQLHKKNIHLAPTLDLITPIWENRPSLPLSPIFEHDLSLAGLSRTEKLHQVRQALLKQGSDAVLCCALDDIAWALNLRGTDIECNPLFMAYLLLTPTENTLYVNAEKIPPTLQHTLTADGIQIRSYHAIESDLENLSPSLRISLDPTTTSTHLFTQIKSHLLESPNPIRDIKAIKNPVEIEHIYQAMRKDGVALTRLFRWLEDTLEAGQAVTEYQVAEQLSTFRAQQPLYKGESFPAIIGYEANGAIVHYRPHPAHAATIAQKGILLLDSGGQYLDGTTDITRTIALSAPTQAQKQHYTLVLKGHIALACCQFPEGTVGMQLDAFARMPLWQAGLSYGHGTGHGVGFFLSVHEGPNGFAPSATTSRGNTPFSAGMLTSNEPGFYLEGAYGIRIENLVLCQAASTKGFLRFDTVSLFPIDTQLIEKSLLNTDEVQWLNDYHQKVFDELAPLLQEAEQAWLRTKCQAI